jgi:pilus assembly protein CpaF
VFIEDEKSTLTRVSGRLTRTDNEMKNTQKLQIAGFKHVI